jgi:hypothetical protein
VIPSEFVQMTEQGSPAQVGRAMEALQQMGKIDLAALREAYGA